MSKFRINLSESFPVITLTKNICSISTHHMLMCAFQEDFFLLKNLSTNPLIPHILITHNTFFPCLESSITWSASKSYLKYSFILLKSFSGAKSSSSSLAEEKIENELTCFTHTTISVHFIT